jgi:outer membrane beta-barrel protein
VARIPVCLLVSVSLWLAPIAAWSQASGDDDLLVPVTPDAAATTPADTAPPPDEVKATTVTEPTAPKTIEKPEPVVAPPKPPEAASTDRIKAVPRKPILKRNRAEVFGGASLSLNDAYYQHFAFAGSAIFYPHDAFGIGVGVDFLYAHPKTSNVDVVRQSLTSVPAVFELPKLFAHVDLYWIPIYGKVSLFESNIIHFDFYGTAGAGVATAFGKRRPPEVNVGVGQRFFLGDWLALRFEVRDHLFVDTQDVDGRTRSDVQSYVMFMAGVSFFIPPSFEYSYR